MQRIGVVYIIEHGLEGRDAPAAYEPYSAIYNCFFRKSRTGDSTASLPNMQGGPEGRKG
ncbi:hypothetical protein HME9302_01203 [Alteripontixanthobacter maritimus]|uniref:Uncharacterized protein n=1 Tax=Alteripontixanthobacter maritimus TaxID=2161824 RepID=A0A369Q8X5_9SPHN|nr:hypothetical protein [Alteripontixanthobacter maritimus]RDC60005.1 hypothetical protein HME9302_01203 [Alteripontixanthobacter maritimus]